ncbi:nucleotidyltransferase family protein [Parabacteroides sp. Marseille-P3160]|uniref:nucleotidyltransferase family protein n=1 Tax=Parabacteroides sp. Marseille-P3160 TaxID=1917887 RepID=UPI0009BB662F|nr:nucleotidyltransferase family protein [Parabacteroides sp. Marseille-P3160]
MKSTSEYQSLLREYMRANVSRYGITRMGIFGSVARGEQTEGSDLDIAYEGKADLFLRIRIKTDLEKLFGCKVDVVRLRDQLSDTFFGDELNRDLIYV